MTPDPRLGVQLFAAYRRLEECALEAVMEAGAHDITPAQARLLARIADDGSRIVDLAAQARVTKQTAGFLVEQLHAAGYVDRVRDPSDGRARVVRLTAKARRLVPLAQAAVADELLRWQGLIGDARMAEVAAAFDEIGAAVAP